jgi:hypothetical protein
MTNMGAKLGATVRWGLVLGWAALTVAGCERSPTQAEQGAIEGSEPQGEVVAEGGAAPESAVPSAATAEGESVGSAVAPQGSPFQRFPTLFVENRGQASEHIDYYVHNGRPRTGFSAGSVTYVLSRPASAEELEEATLQHPELGLGSLDEGMPSPHPRHEHSGHTHHKDETGWSHTWTVRVEFEGADRTVRPRGRDQAETVISFFKGEREDWKTAIPTYHQLAYENLWPEVDLVYVDRRCQPAATFHLKPGADPGKIRLGIHGAKEISVGPEGHLLIDMDMGIFVMERFEAQQEVNGQIRNLDVNFAVRALEAGRHEVSLVVGDYDRSGALVLAPRDLTAP